MEKEVRAKRAVRNINRPVYFLFLVGGIYFMIVKDFSQAVIFLGLGLAFDPFKIETPFPQRPFYQKAWLIVHLSITLALVVLALLGR